MGEQTTRWNQSSPARISRRRGLGIVAGGGMAALLAACNSGNRSSTSTGQQGSPSAGGSAKQPKKGGTLVLGFESDVGPLTVDLSGGIVTTRATRHIYEALVDRDYENFHDAPPRRPVLAERWDVSPDGLTYTFALRQSAKFHDGTPWNAAAAKFNIDRLIDSSHPTITPRRRPVSALGSAVSRAPRRSTTRRSECSSRVSTWSSSTGWRDCI